jgi:hypothetical protein
MNMKVVLIDTCYPINVRNRKIIYSLAKLPNMDIGAISWNRDGRNLESSAYKEFVFEKRANYGNKLLKLGKLYSYVLFIKKVLGQVSPDIIIASHWDMLVVAAVLRGKSRLIYDVIDMPTSSNRIVYWTVKALERVAISRCETIIFGSRFFEQKYARINKAKLVVDNKPLRTIMRDSGKYHLSGNRFRVGFVGTIRYFNIMCNLISACENLPVDVCFFGLGPDEPRLKMFSRNNANVHYYGKYDYQDIGSIYNCLDAVWAAYPSKDENVKYAISNKFFESLVFKKVGIYAANTRLGEFVEKRRLGVAVDVYEINSIANGIKRIMDAKVVFNDELWNEGLFWEDEGIKYCSIIK